MNVLLPTCEALLVADVGNTRIALGVWDEDGLRNVERIAATDDQSWRAVIDHLWQDTRGARERAVVLSSVSPRAARLFADAVLEQCAADVLEIKRDIPLPLDTRLDSIEDVGVDRICAAAAAYANVAQACAVASFGTATTVDCVSPEGEFLGGAILPGVQMSLDALHEFTAQLPRVQPSAPRHALGTNTEDAIRSGVVFGLAGALRELVERYAERLGQWPRLVVTGGNAPLIASIADFVDDVVPDLTLMGVAYAYRRAAGQL